MSNQAIYTPPIKKMPKHGMVGQPEYWAWRDIKKRCYNPNNKWYKNYGGRGIKMQEDWVMSFQAFYRDIGKRPGKGYSIDRIDNNKNYTKGNCKWSTKIEQDNNRRTNVPVVYKGKTTTIALIARDIGIKQDSLRYHFRKTNDINLAIDKASK